MRIKAFAAFAAVSFTATASAEPAPPCEIHVYPAERLQSVGEDFDAVHRVDQDLKHYAATAGRPLDWLTPSRQLELLGRIGVGEAVGLASATIVPQQRSLKRSEANAPGPHTATPPQCLVEVMLPQVMLERGGLSARSLRLFGVVRHYSAGEQTRSHSSFASAPMAGFRMKDAADLPAATALVEQAYVEAARKLLASSTKPATR